MEAERKHSSPKPLVISTGKANSVNYLAGNVLCAAASPIWPPTLEGPFYHALKWVEFSLHITSAWPMCFARNTVGTVKKNLNGQIMTTSLSALYYTL